MIVVYVRHYLTEEGMRYFTEKWYPHVIEVVKSKEGFISIECKIEGDLAFIDLRFATEKSLDSWCREPDHELLISSLDRYRSRDYWESAWTLDHNAIPQDVCWDIHAAHTL